MDFENFRQQHDLIKNCRSPSYAMLHCCECGDLLLAQKMIREFPEIDIHHSFCSLGPDYYFRTACGHGHLNIAKWLKNAWPEINHAFCDHRAFKISVNNKKIAKWLITLYDISTIDEIIDICFAIGRSDLVNFTISHMDIIELKISGQYQDEFDELIAQNQISNSITKSARNF